MGLVKQDILLSRKTNNISVDSVSASTPALLKTGIANWMLNNQNKTIVDHFKLFEATLGTTTSYTWIVLYSNFKIE